MAALDDLVKNGRFATRSDVLRAALAQLLEEERQQAIDDAYRRGYERFPQEEWIGQDGLALFAAWDAAEGGEPL